MKRSRSFAKATAAPAVAALAVLGVVYPIARGSPFAAVVVEFSPAPGQFVQNASFNDPTRALGAPHGGGTSAADNGSIVSLGGFGGSITLAFDHTVEDDPLNPLGLDAIVFGNAFWVGGDPEQHAAEAGTIEIALDVNGNGVADPAEWFLIPGSHIPDPSSQWTQQTWDEDIADPTYPPAFGFWIPLSRIGTGVWTTQAYLLPASVFGQPTVTNPAPGPSLEGIFGYADHSPTLILGDLDADNIVDDPDRTPEAFYTVPDDPFTIGMSRGSGGGDAFDIAWAIDPQTGMLAHLTGFDFIRITTAVHVVRPPLGEVSTEIDAVADVAPDPFGNFDGDDDIDLADLAGLQNCFGDRDVTQPPCNTVDREPNQVIDLADYASMVDRVTGPR